MGKLDNKVAIVTGASRGIGRDMAVVFAREGARVVVSARTEKEGDFRAPGSIASALERIRAEGGTAIGIRCDVTNDEQLEDLVTRTIAEFGRVDILVNNAGIQTPGSIKDMLVRHWDLSYRVNIRGPFIACRAVLPHMVDQGWGHIINISSRAAVGPGKGPYSSDTPRTTSPGGTTYGVSKAALERFTQGLAYEVWEHNVAVNILHPGKGIVTEGGNYFRGTKTEDMRGWRVDGQIMGDAGVVICTKEPTTFTGNIFTDEEVLQREGLDINKYPTVPE